VLPRYAAGLVGSNFFVFAFEWEIEMDPARQPQTLTFTTLEARIRASPDGPAAVLRTPAPIYWLNVAGTCFLVAGLLPFVLVQIREPALWMVYMARAGAWGAALLYGPGVLRGVVIVALEFWRWRAKMVAQADHDLGEFRALRAWLQTFPREVLEEYRQFARMARDRLGSKLALLTGGIERIGILPVFVAMFLLLREVEGLGIESLRAVPLWQAVVGPFIVVTWCLGIMAVRMRLSYELYEVVLADALATMAPSVKGAGASEPESVSMKIRTAPGPT
jgi:hypothetical protein